MTRMRSAAEPAFNPLLRGSKFAIAVACPGALKLAEAMQRYKMTEPPSTYAEEGTTAHALAAHLLELGKDRDPGLEGRYLRYLRRDGRDYVQVVNNSDTGFAYEDMIDAVGQYVRVVLAARGSMLQADAGAEMHVEHKVPVPIFEGRPGTIDCLLISRKLGRALLFDYKNGQGVPTSARVQGKCYSIGVIKRYPFVKEVGWAVIQPNVAHYGLAWRGIMKWTAAELDMTADAWSALIANPEPVLNVGPHCASHFCTARGVCPAIKEETKMRLKTAQMTEEQLRDNAVYFVRNGPAIKSAITGAEQRLLLDLDNDKALPDTVKVVRSSGRGKWITPQAGLKVTEAVLGTDGVVTSRRAAPISSLRTGINRVTDDDRRAELQALLDANYIKGEGKQSLVPAEDARRPATHQKKFAGGPDRIDL